MTKLKKGHYASDNTGVVVQVTGKRRVGLFKKDNQFALEFRRSDWKEKDLDEYIKLPPVHRLSKCTGVTAVALSKESLDALLFVLQEAKERELF